jgi:hypothetical protein
MSQDALLAVRDTFIPTGKKPGKKNQEAEGAQPVITDTSGAGAGLPTTVAELNTLIANSVAEAFKTSLPAALTDALKPVHDGLKANTLSTEDKAALETAKQITANRKIELVTKVVANSNITKEQAEAMDLPALEVVANGLRPASDFSGRPTPIVNTLKEDDPELQAMGGEDIAAQIRANAAERGTLKVVK